MWTISYNGTEKSLADWGLTDLSRSRQNLGVDTVQFFADGRAVDADEIFPYGSTIIIYRDREQDGDEYSGGKRWFYGRIAPWRRSGSGSSESQAGSCVGPMWYLLNRVFRQSVRSFAGYQVPNDPTSPQVFETKTFSHVFLNLSVDAVAHPNGKLTWREQVIEALQWAITCGDPIQIGTVTPNIDVPIDEQKNITVMEVLQQMLRWCPDATFWFDYSTAPYPTLHCKRQSELIPVAINLNAGRPLEDIEIVERQDWKRPYVLLQYEREVNGVLQVIDDVWPNPIPAGPPAGGLETTIDLKGWTYSKLSQAVETAAYDITDVEWWKFKQPWLKNANIKTVTLIPANHADATLRPSLKVRETGAVPNGAFVRELLPGGGIAEWMTGLGAQRVRATAFVEITLKNGAIKKKEQIHHDFVITNATTRVYSMEAVTQVGDPVPVGLAKEIYTALQALGCEGAVTLTDEEIPGVLDFGNAVNFTTPKRPTWANLNAIIQQIEESATRGSMSVRFGAPDRLTPGELVDLLHVARKRFNMSPSSLRSGGAGATGASALPDKMGDGNSTNGGGGYQKHVVGSDPAGDNTTWILKHDASGALPQIAIQKVNENGTVVSVEPNDAADAPSTLLKSPSVLIGIDGLPNGKLVSLRPCQLSVAGVLKTVYVACTDAFTASGGGTKWCKVKTVAGDYLICREWDGAQEGGTDIYVAKRPENRQSMVTETIDGVAITYTYNGANERVARDQYNNVQTEVMYRRYGAGELIWAAEAATGLKVTVQGMQKDITYVESVNRIWLRKYLT